MTKHHKVRISILITAITLCGLVFFLVSQKHVSQDMQISFLDVGQGDAIYIETPNKTQVLIDAGGGNEILRELNSVMPFADRSIDLVVVTNPDKDHIGGFIDVFERYEVSYILEPGTFSSSDTYKKLIEVSDSEAQYYIARHGMKIVLDIKRNIYLEIIFPDTDVSNLKTNEGSLVMQLVYGKTKVLLTGDTVSSVEEELVKKYREMIPTDILKVAHHGSKTSTSESFILLANPLLAVISSGKDNSYGHPHSEVTERLKQYQIPYAVTAKEGRVTLYSNGEVWRRK